MEENFKIVGVDTLRPNPWNPNVQSDFMFERARNSIREFGFVDPVTVRRVPGVEGFEVVDGEHRWRAAKLEGLTSLPVIDLGELPDNVAKRLTIVLNEIAGKPDMVRMSELIAELHRELGTEGLTSLPYTDADIKRMVDISEFDFDAAVSALPTPETQDTAEDPRVVFRVKLLASEAALVEKAAGLAAKAVGGKGEALGLVEIARLYLAQVEKAEPIAQDAAQESE